MKIDLTDQKEILIKYTNKIYSQKLQTIYVRKITFDTITERLSLSVYYRGLNMSFDYKRYIIYSRKLKLQKIKNKICISTN